MHTSTIARSATSLLALWALLPLSVASPVDLNGAELADVVPNDAPTPEDPVTVETIPSEPATEEPLPEETTIVELKKRCDNPCGYYSQLCCASGETCGTNNGGEAVCVGSSGNNKNGRWEYWTTTIIVTETDTSTITSVGSSYVSQPTGKDSGTCKAALGETQCGDECCGAAYVCSDNKCVMGSSSIWATATEANPPVRGTSATTLTATADVTTTQGFEAPVGTDGASLIGVKAEDGGLSGGAIAGIVIGTIAGAFLLLLICACLCCRGLIEGLLACLGIGKRKRRQETTYVEEHHSHHAHGGPGGRTWFGTRPTGASSHGEKKSGWSSLAWLGILVGAIALCLGLKRRRDHDEKTESSYPSSYSYYTYGSYSSPSSSESSDRRTRYTRRSRRSGTRSRRS